MDTEWEGQRASGSNSERHERLWVATMQSSGALRVAQRVLRICACRRQRDTVG